MKATRASSFVASWTNAATCSRRAGMLDLLIHSIASMILSAISDTVSNEIQLLLSVWSDRRK